MNSTTTATIASASATMAALLANSLHALTGCLSSSSSSTDLFNNLNISSTALLLASTSLALLATYFALRSAYNSLILYPLERPVDFAVPVPIPPEVKPDWHGKAWSEVQGADREILEAQSYGVCLTFFFSPSLLPIFTCSISAVACLSSF